MSCLSVHNVERVSVSKIRNLDQGIYSMHISFYDKRWHRTEVTIFAGNADIFKPLTTELEEE